MQVENPTEILLQDRKITKLGNLAPLSSLRRLDVSFNELTSLKGIEELPQLRHLSAYCCRLTDIDMLAGYVQIHCCEFFEVNIEQDEENGDAHASTERNIELLSGLFLFQ